MRPPKESTVAYPSYNSRSKETEESILKNISEVKALTRNRAVTGSMDNIRAEKQQETSVKTNGDLYGAMTIA